jgi:hypothetical protein
MRLSLMTWNGHNINDTTNYIGYIPGGQLINLKGQASYVTRVAAFPFLSSKILSDHYLTIEISCRGTISTQWDELKGWFAIDDFTSHQLIAKDQADSDRQWYLSGMVIQVVEPETGLLAITFALDDPMWRVVTASTSSWDITASGQTKALSNIGNRNAKPVFSITPTSARTGGYSYKWWRPVINPLSTRQSNYPFELMGSWDTATLVTASKMLASGDDLRVVCDGFEIDRWLADINTDHTKVWIRGDWSAKQTATLEGNFSDSGAIATIYFKNTDANRAVLKALAGATNKIVVIGTEAFYYSNTDDEHISITGCARAQKGTSMAAHSDGDTITWIEHDIWIMYGNDAATAPTTDDTKKPLLNLSTSTNSSWVWTNFYDTTSQRPGAWEPSINSSLGKTSCVYTGDQEASANPSTDLGLSLMAWMMQNTWRAETGEVQWSIYNPAGLSNIAYSGKVYQNGTAFPVPQIQTSLDGKTWTAIYSVADPSEASWTAFSSTTAIAGNAPCVRLVISGSISGAANDRVSAQWDAITLTLNSSNVPQVTAEAEISNYHMLGTLKNNTTGDSITINYLMGEDRILTIDCENRLAYYDDGSPIFAALSFSSVRADWMNLISGTNTLQFDDTGTGDVTIAISWRDRKL